MKRGAIALFIAAVVAAGCGNTEDRIVVAAGTTLVDSGFIERVFEEYPADVNVSVVAASSREALALGSAGSAQLLITHLAQAEDEFLADHPDALVSPVITGDFALVGPVADTLDTSDVVEALRQIAAEGHPFVSRGDGSGTAAKEQELWNLAGIDPKGESWYIETGQGMGFTLQVADQRDAFTLAEIGSFVAAESLSLVRFVGGDDDERLVNPYRVTLVEGASDEATQLFHWLVGTGGLEAITVASFEVFGEPIYRVTSPELQT